jgi:hypothetical protein
MAPLQHPIVLCHYINHIPNQCLLEYQQALEQPRTYQQALTDEPSQCHIIIELRVLKDVTSQPTPKTHFSDGQGVSHPNIIIIELRVLKDVTSQATPKTHFSDGQGMSHPSSGDQLYQRIHECNFGAQQDIKGR